MLDRTDLWVGEIELHNLVFCDSISVHGACKIEGPRSSHAIG